MPAADTQDRPTTSGPPGARGAPGRAPLLLLLLLLAVTCAAHVAWIRADVGLMPHSDTYNMLSRTLRFINESGEAGAEGLDDLWERIGEMAVAGRPPLYQLLSVPSLMVWGRDQDGAQISNLLYLVLLGLGTFYLGREVEGPWVGVVAAAIVLTYPPIVHLVALYRPHAAFPGLAAVLLLEVVRVLRHRRLWDVWGVMAVLAAGAWIHPSFAFFAAAPVGAMLVLLALRARRERSASDAVLWWRGLIPGLGVVAILAFAWYATFGQQILVDFVRWKEMGVESLEYEGRVRSGFRDVPGNSFWYLRTAPHVLTWFHVLLGAGGLALAVASRRAVPLVLALHVVVGYAMQAILDNGLHWYRIAGILPALAVLSASLIFTLRWPLVRWALVALVCLIGAFDVAYVLRGGERLDPVARVLGGPVGSTTCVREADRSFALCSHPPETEAPLADVIIARLAELPACRSGCRVMVVQREGLSAVLLRTALEVHRPDLRIRFLSIGTRRLGGSIALPGLLRSHAILYVEGQMGGENFNTAAERFLRSSAPVFWSHHREVWRTDLRGGSPVVLLERTRPLTPAEIHEAVAALPTADRSLDWARRTARSLEP